MNREKQIEEIANIINEMDDRNAHYYDEYMRECEAFADANAIAKVLYEAGYRKQSTVIDEFVYKLKIRMVCTSQISRVTYEEVSSLVEEIIKKMKVGEG